MPRSIRLPTGQLLLNPGSVGLQAYTDEDPVRYSMELGTPDAHYAIIEKSAGRWVSANYTVPYDSASMATLATANNRPDWAKALLHGYVL